MLPPIRDRTGQKEERKSRQRERVKTEKAGVAFGAAGGKGAMGAGGWCRRRRRRKGEEEGTNERLQAANGTGLDWTGLPVYLL